MRLRANSKQISTGEPDIANEPAPALAGVAFEFANAGYEPMPDLDRKNGNKSISSASASLREAAEQRAGSSDEVVARGS